MKSAKKLPRVVTVQCTFLPGGVRKASLFPLFLLCTRPAVPRKCEARHHSWCAAGKASTLPNNKGKLRETTGHHCSAAAHTQATARKPAPTVLNMECGARSEVALLQIRSIINLQHPSCGPSITTMLRELDMLRYSCAGRRRHATSTTVWWLCPRAVPSSKAALHRL